MGFNKIITLLVILVILVFIFAMYQEYAKNKKASDQLASANQLIAQYNYADLQNQGGGGSGFSFKDALFTPLYIPKKLWGWLT